MKYYIDALKNYANFEGRTGVRGYWYFLLFNFIFSIGIMIFGAAMGDYNGFLYNLYSLGIIIPTIAIGIRRLHDINKSGWNTLWLLIPLVNIILILIWFTEKGTKGKNKYGLQPKK